jgi:type IX secretion system PorP/SprF family membrane protein
MKFARLIILTVLMVGVLSETRAQQDPQFTQYMFNQLFYNPGYAGVEGLSKFTLAHRTQWTGYNPSFGGSGGAPTTTTVNFTTPIYKLQSGFGAEITNDNLGPLNNLGLQATYAYHLNVKDKKLSLGVRLGVISQSIDFDQYLWADPDDPYRLEGKETQVRPDLGLGLYYQAEKYFAGLSLNHLIERWLSL